MDVTGDRSKIQCCKEQYCIGTWNVRSSHIHNWVLFLLWPHPFILSGVISPLIIANIRWIMEKAREFQKHIYFCFIDYAKAFDCVDHKKL